MLQQTGGFNPDGYFLSNGPGDPEPLEHTGCEGYLVS
jgi:carbamoylphosphate synthase small subunit